MDVSEHLQRELIYGLNAALLRLGPRFDPASLASVLLAILDREGERHHEPDLVDRWSRDVGMDRDELSDVLEETFDLLREELDDEEVAWSAHRLLELLASEAFWVLRFDLPGEPLPVPLDIPRGLALPLRLRPAIVAILDRMELALFEANQAQRSVHDALPTHRIHTEVERAVRAISALDQHQAAALVRTSSTLPTLTESLVTIQGWKLAVGFDASPDDDDGEWTLRVLERLYSIEWQAGKLR